MSSRELEKTRSVSLACPACGNHFTTQATQVVVEGSPDFTALQEGKLNMAVCPACHQGGPVPLPFVLYQPGSGRVSCYIPEFSTLNEQTQQTLVRTLFAELEQALGAQAFKPGAQKQISVVENYEDIVKLAQGALPARPGPVPARTPGVPELHPDLTTSSPGPAPEAAVPAASRPNPTPQPPATRLLTLVITGNGDLSTEPGEMRPAVLVDERSGRTWEAAVRTVPSEKIARAYELMQKHHTTRKFSHTTLSPEAIEMEELGRLFYASLLPPAFSQVLNQTWEEGIPVIHLSLELPADLQAVPWELLATEDGFLANQPAFIISRQVRVNPLHSQPPATGPGQLPLRVLLVEARPPNSGHPAGLYWERDLNLFRQGLAAGQEAGQLQPGQVDFEVEEQPSLANFERSLADTRPHLLFLQAHGFYKPEYPPSDPRRSGLVLEDEHGGRLEVPGRELGHLLAGQPELKGVILGGPASLTAGSPQGLLETGQLLVRAGLQACLVFPEGFEETASRAFGSHFIPELLRGRTFGEAVASLRTQLAAGIANSVRPAAWAEPVLFTAGPESRPFQNAHPGPGLPRPFISGLPLSTYVEESLFAGRRLEQRILRNALTGGGAPLVVVTGPEGSGTSRLVRLELSRRSPGFRAIHSLSGQSWPGVVLAVREIALALSNAGQPALMEVLSQATPALEDRELGQALAGALNAGPNLLFIDDFGELLTSAMPDAGTAFRPSLAAFMGGLLDTLKEGRVVVAVTSANLKPFSPAEVPPEKVCLVQLGPLGQTESLFLMKQFKTLTSLTQPEKVRLYKAGLNSPGLIGWAAALRELPDGVGWQTEIILLGEHFKEESLLGQLFEKLSPTALRLLRRAAVYRRPLPFSFFQAQLPEESVGGAVWELLERRLLTALALPGTKINLYSLPGKVRRLNLKALEKEEGGEGLRQAHRQAAQAYEVAARQNPREVLDWLEAREHHLAAGELAEVTRINQLMKPLLAYPEPSPRPVAPAPAILEPALTPRPEASPKAAPVEQAEQLIRLEEAADNFLQQGEAKRALELYGRGLTLARQSHNSEAEGVFLVKIASAHLVEGDIPGAIETNLAASLILLQIEHPAIEVVLNIFNLVKSQVGEVRFEALLRESCQKEGVDYQGYKTILERLGFYNQPTAAPSHVPALPNQPEETSPDQAPESLEKLLGMGSPERPRRQTREIPDFRRFSPNQRQGRRLMSDVPPESGRNGEDG